MFQDLTRPYATTQEADSYTMFTPNPTSYFMEDRHAEEVVALDNGHLLIARQAWLRGDFDTARMAYQKSAYISARLDGEELKKALKRELTGFAQSDPLYRRVLAEIRPIVNQAPGIKQTDLYGRLAHDRETVSYVLYFAGEIFDLVRKKSGRTYQVFPPGRVIDV